MISSVQHGSSSKVGSVDGGGMEEEDAPVTKNEDRYSAIPRGEESPAAAYQRLKRDEWSEGAVGSLLDSYEEKWSMRNRAKLKGHDWEEVAKRVSARANSTKGPKTSTQCKNKIESMKKRYRSEVAAADPTSWPLFPRLDLMLRGGVGAASCQQLQQPASLQQLDQAPPPPPPPAGQSLLLSPPSPDRLNGVPIVAQEEATEEKKERCNIEECDDDRGVAAETDSVTPKCDSAEDRTLSPSSRKVKKTRKRERGNRSWEVTESVRWLAEVMLRSEQARSDAMKEVEKIRADVEAHKAQMEVKRTEIIANTQLQIARLLVGKRDKTAPTDSSFAAGKH